MVLLLMIRTGVIVTGLFKEKLFEYLDINNALFMDSSTSVCDINKPKSFANIAHLAWLKFGLAPVFRWSHRHGAAIDDVARV